MSNFENLKSAVFSKSEEKQHISKAFMEWFVVGYYIDTETDTSCVCGKPHIKYIFCIENKINGNVLEPIGCECVKKFDNPELDKSVKMGMNGNTVFNNDGKAHHNKTYHEICSKHPDYVVYLKTHAFKKKYLKLVEYYDFFKSLKKTAPTRM
jgi:hypothetical protein